MAKNTTSKSVSIVKPVAAAKAAPAPAPASAPPAPMIEATSQATSKKARLTRVEQMARKIPRLQKQVDRLSKLLKLWGHASSTSASQHLAEAADYLKLASTEFGNVPTNYEPARGSSGYYVPRTDRLAEGGVVEIAARHRDAFKGLLDEEDMTHLTVVKVIGKRVIVASRDGIRHAVASNRLRPQSAESKAKSDAAAAE